MKNNYDFSSMHLYCFEYLFSLEFEIEIGIDAIKTILNKQDIIIDETKSKLTKSIEEDDYLKSIKKEDREDYISQIYQREAFVISEISTHQMHSLCLLVFSFTEGRLKYICEFLETRYQHKIKCEDLSTNDDLMRYWNFLTKVYEINPYKVEKYFTPIKQQKIVRNIIAHQDGKPRKEQISKINIIKGLEVIEYGENYLIKINSKEYIVFLLDKVELFFKELLKAIDIRYEEIEKNK
jgi:hypothetical protein